MPTADSPAQCFRSPFLWRTRAINQLLIQAYLKRTPHRVDIAESACGKFNVGRHDLVLMDIPMPGMDAMTPPARYGNKRRHP